MSGTRIERKPGGVVKITHHCGHVDVLTGPLTLAGGFSGDSDHYTVFTATGERVTHTCHSVHPSAPSEPTP